MYFADESAKSLQVAFEKIITISSQAQDGDYLKAQERSKWDFTSMQLTRASTTVARSAGYDVKSIRQGRLKSVIVRRIYDQMEAIKRYVKQPFYQVKFKDQNGHIFTSSDDDQPTFIQKNICKAELTKYHETQVSSTIKTRAPEPLLDLFSLAAKLTPPNNLMTYCLRLKQLFK
ncbi:hypothetical protein HU830_01425 [Lactobacillus sp. DCY120]|uniref:Uncharacterized protein n=1 Tax=Bombilactobacillus apium TaxID=2675299 RepID=A0A850QYR0_9LACO|nr:hypothetical protein [Bombilactobacillus apium]NVY95869.1 hypothetical protein [Bombilactobacillus apium]